MNEQLILDLVREIREDVKKIREIQIEQGFVIKTNQEDLAEHMRRTEVAETRIDKTEERLDIIEQEKQAKKYSWKLISMICAGFAGVVSFAYTVYSFYLKSIK